MKQRISDATLSKLEKTAVRAALKAGEVLAKHFRKPLIVREKKQAGLVTQVDVAAEKASIRELKKGFPEFSILAEESGLEESLKSSGRWIIDPLDGTTNFVHGFPMFCVSIAAEVEGQLQVGVIYHPILKDLYVAVRGRGATKNGKRLRVSKTAKLRDALLTTGFTYRKTVLLRREMAAFEKLSAVARAVRRPGSAALDLAYTASGVFDGFWERRLSPWDVAAGILLVEEAGGLVSDLHGKPFRLDGDALLVTNGRLHSPLLRSMRGTL